MPPPLGEGSSRKHQCSTCNKAYSTNSHLRRHEATHSGKHLLTCPFCHSHFSRRDIACRHVKGCSTDGLRVMFPTLKRGKKRMACDKCSQRKLSCDTNAPCTRCRSSGITCTYRRLDLSASFSSLHYATNGHSKSSVIDSNTSSGRECGRMPIDFLLNFTNASGYSASTAVAADAVDPSTAKNEVGHSNPQLYLEDNYMAYETPFWDFDDPFLNFFDVSPSRFSGEYCFNHDDPSPKHQETLALEARMSSIVYELSAMHNSGLRHDFGVETNFDVQLAAVVFTVANLRRFTWGFFHYFHHHIPIIHRPTFNSETVSLPLLLAIFLFGSMCSAPLDMAISTRRFFDIAEAYIFDHSIFKQVLQGSLEGRNSNDEVEILQAALMVLIIQNNKNDVMTRRRIRLQRSPCLIAAVRISGLFGHKRQYHTNGTSVSKWQNFISDEIRVRMAAWTFITDSISALFFNNPPQVAIFEMLGDFPCEEDLFEAETASDFERLALALLGPTGPQSHSLSEFTSFILSESVLTPQIYLEGHITVANMLIAIYALQSVAITLKMNLLAPAVAGLILRGTDRWKSLWDTVTKGEEYKSERQKGFVRHAAEFWWLTRTIVRIGQSGDPNCRYMQCIPSDSVKDLHDFIRKYESKVE
ncbi:hypothetical protein B0J11DRAFT_190920 [Dendryphion nanum]|uniref:Zn(2)-C6 fungal-type domain-containing protein n=1 Tax=Dendryphion nanum TaxID=256645 RepID=A0A9P9D311_9PLEO|nr:hypothetical protein B0J11DRAFT_190920 [Dendryphion nanum]